MVKKWKVKFIFYFKIFCNHQFNFSVEIKCEEDGKNDFQILY